MSKENLIPDTKIKRYSMDNLKELQKEINDKIFSLLDKVKRTNLTAPCIMNFLVDYTKAEVGITITHRKQDNRMKDIPKSFKNIYKGDIPTEDYEYFYFSDSKKGFSNLLISPDFVFSTMEFDMNNYQERYIKSEGFLIFPRSLYSEMKNVDKMLFSSIDLEIKDDKLIVNYETFNKIKLLPYRQEMDSLMRAELYPIYSCDLPQEMKDVMKKFFEKKKAINTTKNTFEESVIKVPFEDSEVEIFHDFFVGKPKTIEFVQTMLPSETSSDIVCTVMINAIYNGWCAYYIYKYLKLNLGE